MKVLSSCVFLFLCSVSGVLGQEFRGDAPPPVFAEAGTSALASKGAEAPPLEILFDVGESCRVDAVDDCDLQESPEPASSPSKEDASEPAIPESDGCTPDKEGCFHLFPPTGETSGEIGNTFGRSVTRQFFSDIWTDQKAIWTAPVKMKRKEFFTIALPLAAVTAGLIAADARMSDAFSDDTTQSKVAQRVGYFGDLYTLGVVTAGPLIGGKIIHRPEYTKVGRNALEAMVASMLANYAIKAAAGRERPFEKDGRGHFFSGGQSFPSGHAMNSWAVAVAIGRTKGCPRWFALTSYAMATAISASRLPARKHFPSDIIVGGVVGGLIGNYVATRKR